jgi:cell wall-associated NlpC family hydrolase
VLGAAKISKISAGTINVISESTTFSIRTGTISVISVNPGRADTTGLNPVNASAAGIGPAGSSPDTIGPDAEELIKFAKYLLGTPYVYGGMSPSGFDCSGFTSYVFGAFGIKLERVSTDQAKQGMEISKENLKPGDLVFFDTSGGHNDINHTGIFIGDGKFIHASSGTSYCVIISDLTTGYYAGNFMTARRIYQTP